MRCGRKEAERAAVLATVQAQLEAIDRKYAQPLAEADQAVAELEAEVKAEVLKAGQSLRAGTVQAVYYRGSVTWDSKGLAEFAQQPRARAIPPSRGTPRRHQVPVMGLNLYASNRNSRVRQSGVRRVTDACWPSIVTCR